MILASGRYACEDTYARYSWTSPLFPFSVALLSAFTATESNVAHWVGIVRHEHFDLTQ